MNVTTQYDIGDEVWTMFDNKPLSARILSIQIAINTRLDNTPSVTITYYLGGNSELSRLKPSQIFPTRETLVASL